MSPAEAAGVRVVRHGAAAALALVVLFATGRHGVAVSTDSVSYAAAADALVERGALAVPLTEWREPAAWVSLSHFPPLFPATLAAGRAALGVDVRTVAPVVNAVCIWATTLVLVRLAGPSLLATATALALLVGPGFVGLHCWLWSEALFMTLVALALARVIAVLDGGRRRDVVLLGLVTGLATLTRYAGVFLVAGIVVMPLLARRERGTTARMLAHGLAAAGAVVAPWIVWLAATHRSARTLGFFPGGLAGLVSDFPRVAVGWVAPTELARPVRIAVLAAVAGGAAIALPGRTRRTWWPTAVAGAGLGVLYVAVVTLARVTVDKGIPFDGRIFAPALVLVVPAIADFVGRTSGAVRRAALATVVAVVFAANVRATAAEIAAARAGRGLTAPAAQASETIDWLRTVGPGVTIFSNAPDAVAAVLSVPAKYTPQGWERAAVASFAERVAAARPAVVVLFDSDPHAGWLLPKAALADLPSDGRRTFADGTVLVWDAAR